MNKIWLIVKREYITRVRKKSFIITTLLLPILMVGLFSLIIFLAVRTEEKQKIVVWDESKIFIDKLDTNSESFSLVYIDKNESESNKNFLKKVDGDVLVHIFPFKDNRPDSIYIFKEGGVSLSAKGYIENAITDVYHIKQLEDAGINKSEIDSINKSNLAIKSFDLENNKETNSEISSMIGMGMGVLIYFIIFIYGAGVMRGVMEEKTNRIAEVIISSVKPFQLMMGKILGIALVGLTQFLMWMVLMTILQLILPLFIPEFREIMHSNVPMASASDMQQLQEISNSEGVQMFQSLMNQNWALISFSFFFYFLGGYFLYAAMFAAVGSLVNEDPQEAQQLTLPITMPIILGFVIMQSTLKDPNSSLSVFGSLFPLTSPIVMLARIPYGVPAWQLILSMVLLILGFLGITWISAKIYRTGILMYGKKITWKEVFKWLKYN